MGALSHLCGGLWHQSASRRCRLPPRARNCGRRFWDGPGAPTQPTPGAGMWCAPSSGGIWLVRWGPGLLARCVLARQVHHLPAIRRGHRKHKMWGGMKVFQHTNGVYCQGITVVGRPMLRGITQARGEEWGLLSLEQELPALGTGCHPRARGGGGRGCRLPGAQGSGWGAEAGAPCAPSVHGGDSTSHRLLRLCQTRRCHVPSSVQWKKEPSSGR